MFPGLKMAPSPENDNTPKAPDKNEKLKGEKQMSNETNKDKNKDVRTLSNLNDGELKDLLDEAMTYKNPKDREGKSNLFNELLNEAEKNERNARATSAGGSEQVRYCNTTAKRSKHRRKQNSISENVMHGGSLDNLVKEDLFEVVSHLNRPRRTVSSRQREGGSLPSNVNSGSLGTYHLQFLEEARRKKEMRDNDYMPIDTESQSLLEHDSLADTYSEQSMLQKVKEIPSIPQQFTSKATFQVNVDEPVHLGDLDSHDDRKNYECEQLSAKVVQSKCSLFLPNYMSEKKVDENGNALHQNKTKKKKFQVDKNVVVVNAEAVEGHRSDIINDMDKLLEYIGERPDQGGGAGKARSNVHKSKLHKHTSEDGGGSRSGGNKKQRAHSSKGKENRSELKKSNSLSEISNTKLDEFAFRNEVATNADNKVIMRQHKNSTGEKPRERRSWGNVEPPPIQNLYKNPSSENVESDFRVVTKKKKTKKRRSSVSSSRRKTMSSSHNSHLKHAPTNRAPSPDLLRKSSSAHSEKSNDSSDLDSVHSLPMERTTMMADDVVSPSNNGTAPISYADIAKNGEKKIEKVPNNNNNKEPGVVAPVAFISTKTIELDLSFKSYEAAKAKAEDLSPPPCPIAVDKLALVNSATTATVGQYPKNTSPPDVHNIKSFPAIQQNNNNKTNNNNNNNNLVAAVQQQKSPVFVNNYTEKVNNSKNSFNNNNRFQKQQPVTMTTTNNNVTKNNNAKNTLQKLNNVVLQHHPHDIQTDLSIIQANEMETIQYNKQLMPINIPDVQTIEKMQFINQQGGQLPPHLRSPPPNYDSLQYTNNNNNAFASKKPYNNNNGGRRQESDEHGSPYTAILVYSADRDNVESVPGGNVTTGSEIERDTGIDVRTEGNVNYNAHTDNNATVDNTTYLCQEDVDSSNKVYRVGGLNYNSKNFVKNRTPSVESGVAVDVQSENHAPKYRNKTKIITNNGSRTPNNPVANNNVLTTFNIESGNNTHNLLPPPPHHQRVQPHPVLSNVPVINVPAPFGGIASSVGDVTATCDPLEGPRFSRNEDYEENSIGAVTVDCDNVVGVENRTSGSCCSSSGSSSGVMLNEQRPAVVILSGAGNKEVSGLVFGFDVNEQLLSDDICENFVSRYVVPTVYSAASHNHDKIVNYIGLAWEEIIRNQSNGKVQYYSENL